MAAFQLVKVVATGCVWDIPAEMYSPIKQKMVLLNKADNNPAAHDFMRYMQSRDAKSIIQSTGYDVL
jgi:molybdate transport system substrate-binding protein